MSVNTSSYKYPMGIYVPAYWGTWKDTTTGIDYNQQHQWLYNYINQNRDLNWVVALNPASGYGFDKALVDWSYMYRQAGAKVIGYISVNYGTQNQRPAGAWGPVTWPHTSLPYLKQQVDLYVRDYFVDGFMWDDHPSVIVNARDTFGQLSWDTSRTTLQTLQEITTYAKNAIRAKGRTPFIKANVGTRPAGNYFWNNMYENINVYESNVLPTVDQMKYNNYDYYTWLSTFTVHHTGWNEAAMDSLAYRQKYICLHESEFHWLSWMMGNMVRWCKKFR